MTANSVVTFDAVGPTAVQVKTAAGTLFGYDIASSDPNPMYVYFYDSSTIPVLGTNTPLLKILIPPFSSKSRTSATGMTLVNGLFIIVTGVSGVAQTGHVAGHIEYV
jgi:hypothetical protein